MHIYYIHTVYNAFQFVSGIVMFVRQNDNNDDTTTMIDDNTSNSIQYWYMLVVLYTYVPAPIIHQQYWNLVYTIH